MKKKEIILLSIILISFIGLSSCKNLPSASQNEKDLRNKIEKVSENKVELIQFVKTNALEEELFGVKYYTISYKGKIKYKENGFLYLNLLNINKEYILKIAKVKHTSPFSLEAFYDIKQNEEKNIIGKIMYSKTENGWLTSNGDIKIIEDKSIK
jgi:hypothetical protein